MACLLSTTAPLVVLGASRWPLTRTDHWVTTGQLGWLHRLFFKMTGQHCPLIRWSACIYMHVYSYIYLVITYVHRLIGGEGSSPVAITYYIQQGGGGPDSANNCVYAINEKPMCHKPCDKSYRRTNCMQVIFVGERYHLWTVGAFKSCCYYTFHFPIFALFPIPMKKQWTHSSTRISTALGRLTK